MWVNLETSIVWQMKTIYRMHFVAKLITFSESFVWDSSIKKNTLLNLKHINNGFVVYTSQCNTVVFVWRCCLYLTLSLSFILLWHTMEGLSNECRVLCHLYWHVYMVCVCVCWIGKQWFDRLNSLALYSLCISNVHVFHKMFAGIFDFVCLFVSSKLFQLLRNTQTVLLTIFSSSKLFSCICVPVCWIFIPCTFCKFHTVAQPAEKREKRWRFGRVKTFFLFCFFLAQLCHRYTTHTSNP